MTNKYAALKDVLKVSGIALGPSVKIVDCRYNCGRVFIVTTMRQRPPAYLECAIKESVEASRQMHVKSRPYYDKWCDRMYNWASHLKA